MSKKSSKAGTTVLDKIEAVSTEKHATTKRIPVIKATKPTQVDADETGEKKAPGRPVMEGSARQMKLKQQEEKKANGELRRGRPVQNDSERQKRLAELQLKKDAGLLTGKQGRPMNPGSDRQQKLATRQAMVIAGLHSGKPGRPKVKAEIVEYIDVDINDAREFVIEDVVTADDIAAVAETV